MSSWSDRPDALVALSRAIAERDTEAVRELFSEKHGDQYADDVLAAVQADVARVNGQAA